MPRPRRRIVVFAAGALAVGGVGLTTAVLWPGLERRYHLEMLRRDPSRFEELLLEVRESRRLAALELLREPAGKEALLRLYLDEYDRSEPSLSTRDYLVRRAQKDQELRGVIALWADGVTIQDWTGSTGHSSFSMANVPKDPRRRAIILGLLDACVGRTFRAPGFEGLELQLQRVSDGKVLVPLWTDAGWLPADYPPGTPSVSTMARHACFFRRVPDGS